MLRTLSHWLAPVALFFVATTLQAQSGSRATIGDPLDARAPVPPLVHESSLAQYRKFSDEPVISWREANETVNRIGGWRAYSREANEPDKTPLGKPSTPAGKAP